MTVTIKTNHNWRPFCRRSALPPYVFDDFDYQHPSISDGYFRYRGSWYHLDDFTTCDDSDAEFKGWDAYAGDSYFSGVLIKLSDDGGAVMCATYFSKTSRD